MKRISCLLLAVLMLLLCGCSKAPSERLEELFQTDSTQKVDISETDKPEQTEVVTEVEAEALDRFGLAYQAEFGLHPYACMSLNNRVALSFLYECLFLVTDSFEIEPMLAESYEVTPDGKTTTITLKDGARFTDGSALTAQDVVYSLEQAKGSAYYGSRLSLVLSISATDEKTISLVTDTAYECLPLLLDIPIIKNGSAAEAQPMGTGPYRREGNTLVRVKAHKGERLLIDLPQIELVEAKTATEVRDLFEYEKVNMVRTDPTSSAYASYHSDYELWMGNTSILQYIGYNLNNKVFANYGLRSAITYAIDRERIVSDHMGGFAIPAVLPCSPLTDFYDVKLANSYDYDLDDFKAQLESAVVKDMDGNGVLDLYVQSLGYAEPVSGTMIVCSSSYQRVQAAQDIVSTLNSLGFDLTLKAMEYDDYRTALRYGNYDLYYGEVRLSSNFDLTQFFSYVGSLCYGDLADSTMLNLCQMALVNNGNTYNLYKRLCGRGYITPILFKTHAVYTTRGAVDEPTHYIDWFFAAPVAEETP